MSNRNKPQRTYQAGQQQPQQIIQSASFYQGIIPKPEDLQHYEQIQPGFANRIIKMTEDESDHRRHMERRVVKNSIIAVYLGQFLGFFSVVGVIYLCYYAFSVGYATQGATIAIGVLIGIAGAFKIFNSTHNKQAGNP